MPCDRGRSTPPLSRDKFGLTIALSKFVAHTHDIQKLLGVQSWNPFVKQIWLIWRISGEIWRNLAEIRRDSVNCGRFQQNCSLAIDEFLGHFRAPNVPTFPCHKRAPTLNTQDILSLCLLWLLGKLRRVYVNLW